MAKGLKRIGRSRARVVFPRSRRSFLCEGRKGKAGKAARGCMYSIHVWYVLLIPTSSKNSTSRCPSRTFRARAAGGRTGKRCVLAWKLNLRKPERKEGGGKGRSAGDRRALPEKILVIHLSLSLFSSALCFSALCRREPISRFGTAIRVATKARRRRARVHCLYTPSAMVAKRDATRTHGSRKYFSASVE